MSEIKTKDIFGRNAQKSNKPNPAVLNKTYKDYEAIDNFLDYLYKELRSEAEICSYINENLVSVYSGKDFRHSYFRISAKIQEIRTKAADNELSYLEANLETLKRVLDAGKLPQVRIQLVKFYDHCSLEISRYRYFDSIFWKGDEAQKQSGDTLKTIQNLRSQIDDLQKEVVDSKAEHITILSIFSAIMLASIGSFNVWGNLIAKLNEASIFRIVFVVCLVGLVLFNTLALLLYLVARITNRSISTMCAKGDCNNGVCSEGCWIITRIRKRFPYVFAFNALLFGIMFVDWLIWRFFQCWFMP